MADPDSGSAQPAASIVQHYRRLLGKKAPASGFQESAFESATFEAGTAGPLELSQGEIVDRVDRTRDELHRIVNEYLGADPELHEIADAIAEQGQAALEAVGEDEDNLLNGDIQSSLEVIVETDGTRPSFLVRNGEPDTATSPLGEWGKALSESAAKLRQAVAAVGRIDAPGTGQGFAGTGTLIGENTVMTNRHVLQAIAVQGDDGRWQLKPDIAVDFGHEFRARPSIGRRKVKGVVYAGSKRIELPIDLGKLDLALLDLEEADGDAPKPLALDIAPDWGMPETIVYIIGYPGNPGANAADPWSLLEQLFERTFGCKRLAPGLVTTAALNLPNSPRQWSLGHDATTLRGNSGSSVFVIGRETVTAGLHFGGTNGTPRENWCHVLGLVLDETDGRSPKSLREVLSERGVELVDRAVSPQA